MGSYKFSAVTDDNNNLRGLKTARAVDHVLQDRLARQFMDDLGARGLHARTLAGGKNDYGKRHAENLGQIRAVIVMYREWRVMLRYGIRAATRTASRNRFVVSACRTSLEYYWLR